MKANVLRSVMNTMFHSMLLFQLHVGQRTPSTLARMDPPARALRQEDRTVTGRTGLGSNGSNVKYRQ